MGKYVSFFFCFKLIGIFNFLKKRFLLRICWKIKFWILKLFLKLIILLNIFFKKNLKFVKLSKIYKKCFIEKNQPSTFQAINEDKDSNPNNDRNFNTNAIYIKSINFKLWQIFVHLLTKVLEITITIQPAPILTQTVTLKNLAKDNFPMSNKPFNKF